MESMSNPMADLYYTIKEYPEPSIKRLEVLERIWESDDDWALALKALLMSTNPVISTSYLEEKLDTMRRRIIMGKPPESILAFPNTKIFEALKKKEGK